MDDYLLKNITIFFKKYRGDVIGVNSHIRQNFEQTPPPGDGFLLCHTVYVVFRNLGLLGLKGDFLSEVHPRLKYLSDALKKYLNDMNFNVNNKESTEHITIVPIPDPQSEISSSLPKIEHKSRGKYIIPIHELVKHSKYYKQLFEKYNVEFGVITSNGTTVGPDGGLLGAACAVASTFSAPIKVMEVGSGSGTTPLVLLEKGYLSRYYGNDFSQEMINFLQEKAQPRLSENGIESSFYCGPSIDMKIETSIDLLSVGIYYEAQPDFFLKKGKDIAAALGDSGVLIAQTGMIENPFITDLVYNLESYHRSWPWYSERVCLKSYFNNIAEVIVEEETIIVATNNLARFNMILSNLSLHSEVVRFNMQ